MLDYEGSNSSLDLVVVVYDDGTPPASLIKNFIVETEDVNEPPHELHLSHYKV